MELSIIVPAHNAEDTLRSCLDGVFSSENRDFEVIVVDDGSGDRTALMAKEYPCKLITLEKSRGSAYSRNIGKENAQGRILVFIDSDVVIKKDTLRLLEETFKENQDIVAVTGILSKECPYQDFFTLYKNLYMHYIFKKCPRFVDFLYGSLFAIKRDYFLKFNENFKITDDTELGQRYKELNRKILLNADLEVIHLKRYGLGSIIENDLFVPFWWVKSFILHEGFMDILKKRRFCHARMAQILSILVSYLALAFLPFLYNSEMRLFFSILLLVYFFLSYDFFLFLFKERGFGFFIKSMIFTFFDMLVMGLGILAGFVHCALRSQKSEAMERDWEKQVEEPL